MRPEGERQVRGDARKNQAGAGGALCPAAVSYTHLAAYGAVLYHLPTILPEIKVIFCAQDAHFCEKTFAARGPVCYYNG